MGCRTGVGHRGSRQRRRLGDDHRRSSRDLHGLASSRGGHHADERRLPAPQAVRRGPADEPREGQRSSSRGPQWRGDLPAEARGPQRHRCFFEFVRGSPCTELAERSCSAQAKPGLDADGSASPASDSEGEASGQASCRPYSPDEPASCTRSATACIVEVGRRGQGPATAATSASEAAYAAPADRASSSWLSSRARRTSTGGGEQARRCRRGSS